MVTFGIILFGLLSDCFLSALVGLLGSRRQIGFTVSFLISIFLTPIAGIIVVLLSDKLPAGDEKLGCFAKILATIGWSIFLILLILILIAAFLAF